MPSCFYEEDAIHFHWYETSLAYPITTTSFERDVRHFVRDRRGLGVEEGLVRSQVRNGTHDHDGGPFFPCLLAG